MERDSVKNTFLVATMLCVVCSVLVSSAAVMLRDAQEANKIRERKKNVLIAAGLHDPEVSIEQTYDEKITAIVIELETGKVEISLDSSTFDQRSAARDPQQSHALTNKEDVAGLKRRERYAVVFLVQKDENPDQFILPIRGMGLWSTLYGFISLDANTSTIRGLTFYEHGETPGLGGEVDNAKWKTNWIGKEAFDEQGRIQIQVIKGTVDPNDTNRQHQVDGLSGATITSRGVTNMLEYWLGDQGFGPFLKRKRDERGATDG
jgi:Na+-transporting NADH:ubiquinone oxidoreductase subunit C